MIIFLYGRVENIVGKGENAGYQHFILFSQCFLVIKKSGLCWKRLKALLTCKSKILSSKKLKFILMKQLYAMLM